MNATRRITSLAMLLTFAVVIHTVEAFFPLPLPVPGVKLGLANIITLLTLLLFGLRGGLVISAGRSVLSSLFTGSFLGFGFMLSLAAGMLSCLAMALVIPAARRGLVSIISVSIVGAVIHNLVQLLIASVIMQNFMLLQGYFPFLVLLAVPTGFFTGAAAGYLEPVAKNSLKIWKVNY